MDRNPNLIYELMEHLDVTTIRKLCSSDAQWQKICQEERFRHLIQSKLVNELFYRISYEVGLEYIVNPTSRHNISISFDRIEERNLGYQNREERIRNSILLNNIDSNELAHDMQYIVVVLKDPTDEQIREVLEILVKLPDFERKRVSYWVY